MPKEEIYLTTFSSGLGIIAKLGLRASNIGNNSILLTESFKRFG
jgi:hypothetical protein